MEEGEGREGRLDLSALFGNNRRVEVDLGCGKGLFLVQEASARPEVNFIGVDRLGRKLERALRRIRSRNLKNVRIFRSDVFHFVNHLLPADSISTFHIYFPDPWPKRKHAQRRFLDSSFVTSLARTLRHGCPVWLATDYHEYYDRILEIFRVEPAFRPKDHPLPPVIGITDFEEEFIENDWPIYRAGFEKVMPF